MESVVTEDLVTVGETPLGVLSVGEARRWSRCTG